MAKVETIFTGNVDHITKAYRKMAAEDAKTKQRGTDASAATKRSKREFESYAKAVERGYQKTLAPADQLKHSIEDIDKRFKAGKMTTETYGKAQKVAWRESGLGANRAATKLQGYNDKMGVLRKLLKKGVITQNEFTAAARKTTNEFEASEMSSKITFGEKGLGLLKSYAGGLVGAGGVLMGLRLIKVEFDNIIERSREASRISQTVESAQEQALTNLGADTPAERKMFVMRADSIAAKYGISRKDVYQRLSSAMSARGDQSMEAAYSAVEGSIKYAPGDTATGIAAAGAALDLGAITKQTPEQSLGYLQQLGKQARIVNPRKLMRNAPPVLRAGIQSAEHFKTLGRCSPHSPTAAAIPRARKPRRP